MGLMRARSWWSGLLAVAAAVCVVVPAGAQDDQGFIAASSELTGYIYLAAFGTPGEVVDFSELVNGRSQRVISGTIGQNGTLAIKALTWSCERVVRHFTAIATAPDGTRRAAAYDLRTPSCANRVAIVAPRHVEPGRAFKVRIEDRWHLGDRTIQFCEGGAGVSRRCRELQLAATTGGLVAKVRPRRSGYVRLATGLAGSKVVQSVAVGTARARPSTRGPVLLTTGDSTIEGIDSFLSDSLGSAARVRSQSFPGSGLSGTGDAGWRKTSAEQVAHLRPRVTVVSIGGNEGFPMTAPGSTASIPCCDDPWIAELARRQRSLMQTYLRAGRGRVVWLTLPVPKDARRAHILAAVDQAIALAARGLPDVRVLDMGAIFTPDGQFHESIQRDGQQVRVRAADGLHLTVAGDAIAADAIRKVIEQAGWLDR